MVSTKSIPPATVGKEYRFCFAATPPSPPSGVYKWQDTWANIPSSGFYYFSQYFDRTGCLDSIPEKDGNFLFSVTVADPNGTVSPEAFFKVHVAASTPAKASDSRLANRFFDLCLKDSPSQSGKVIESISVGVQAGLDCGLAIYFEKRAADTPDPNFTTIAQPAPFPFVFPNTGWPAYVSEDFDALLTDQAEVFGYARAALIATERAQGAQAAGNELWSKLQSEAAAQFDELLTQKMAGYLPRAARFATAYRAAGLPDIVFTPAEIDEIRAALPNLPLPLVTHLTTAGLTSDDIAVLARLLAAQTVPVASVSLFTLEQQEATALTTEAPNLSPVAALRVAIENPSITQGIRISLAAELNNAELAIGKGQFDNACGMLTALGRHAIAQRGIGIPPAQDDAIIAALVTTRPFCPGQDVNR
jgi:hypothetical protein